MLKLAKLWLNIALSEAISVVYPMSDLYLDEPGAIRQYTQLFHHLRAAALAHDKSVAFVANVPKEL